MTEIVINSYIQRLNNLDVAWGRALLSESGIFDQLGYVARAGEETRSDPIGHYLETGWRFGLEPNDSFPGTFLLPYFACLLYTSDAADEEESVDLGGWRIVI